MDAREKTDVAHWDENWRRASTALLTSEGADRDTFLWRRMAAAISRALERTNFPAKSVIEIGAGGSEWLPLLHQTYGLSVAGLDYSEVGCESARQLLKRSGVQGNIHYGDMFHPPTDLIDRFDLVVSFGLVEHFENTASAISACARFLRPQGMMLTTIPNMAGLHGIAYRIYDKKVFDTHRQLSLAALVAAHEAAGLEVVRSECLFGLPGVFDGARKEPNSARRIFRACLHQATLLNLALESRGWGFPENGFTSPYLFCAALKPA